MNPTPSGTPCHLPLEGLRVVECTPMVIGLTCGMVLADMGSEGITVESLEGDRTRHLLGVLGYDTDQVHALHNAGAVR